MVEMAVMMFLADDFCKGNTASIETCFSNNVTSFSNNVIK